MHELHNQEDQRQVQTDNNLANHHQSVNTTPQAQMSMAHDEQAKYRSHQPLSQNCKNSLVPTPTTTRHN